MSRALRPRKARPSYAAMFTFEDENGAGPSNTAQPFDDEQDSGSEFEAEEGDKGAENDDDLDEADEEEVEDYMSGLQQTKERLIRPLPTKSATKAKTKKSPPDAQRMGSVQVAPSLPRGYSNKIYALPSPSIHHRHRAVPLFTYSGRVERLKNPPKLFAQPQITVTNNFTFSRKVQDRVGKAWGYNVGSGPLWELLEDRGWYKEGTNGEDNVERDATRRPIVHANVRVKTSWQILNAEDASPYLPSDTVIADDGTLKPPPPVACSFGPFGSQTRVELNIFESRRISEFIPESKSHVFNAGSPVWGVDWCPIHFNDRTHRSYAQFLAIAPFPTRSHSPEIGVKVLRPSKACIQIWTLRSTRTIDAMDDDADDVGELKCEMVLCLEGGPAYDVKWCPLPSHDNISDPIRPRKLGLLAGTFEDGSVSIYAVPEPLDVTPPNHDISRGPVFVKLTEPILRLELDETSCWTLDWANSELLAVGCTNGNIAVYDIGKALKSGNGPNLLPTHYLTIHQSAIRALAWIRTPSSSASGTPLTGENPTVIASGGYDGVECLTDIREPHGNIMNRTRDVINSITFTPFSGGPITIDHENTVKAYSVSPMMLGRGHTLLEPSGPVWTVHGSDYHPQLAVGSADGSCVTANALRSTRRGGAVPFFVHKIYQLDYNRSSGEFRMLERFFPQETVDKPATAKVKAKTNTASSSLTASVPPTTGVWPPLIGVHRVVWNTTNGLSGASLLGSATASGLCRVDWLEGRWLKGNIPYRGIEAIRVEGGPDDMDEDDDDLEEQE